MATTLNARIDKLERTKAEMDKPRITRLLFYQKEEIPDEVPPGGLPILIWDLPGMDPDDSKEVGVWGNSSCIKLI
jgi:hypothetical protein